jgi:exosome complex component RRP46
MLESMKTDDGAVVVGAVVVRDDSRDLQFRPLQVDLGLTSVGNSKVQGSAKWTSGRTVVAAQVKGPEASPAAATVATSITGEITVNVKAIVKPVAGMVTEQEQELEDKVVQFVEGVLDRSCPPRTTITVIVHILSQDGSLLACILNATAAALLEAGIPLCGTPASICLAMPEAEANRVLLEPDSKEERYCSFAGTFSFLFSSLSPPSIILMSTRGKGSTQNSVVVAMTAAEQACKQHFQTMKGLFEA